MNTDSLDSLIPARLIREYVYCPRDAYINWVEGNFSDNVYTVDGRYQHRRVDKPRGKLNAPDTDPEEAPEKLHASSVYLSAPKAGIVAKIDLVETDGQCATPIDYKRGRAPTRPEGPYDADRVQICAQALVLEENGYRCTEGILYFVQSKQRVSIPITDELCALTLNAIQGVREMLRDNKLPPPLIDSPKCKGCSLVGICLPDEITLLKTEEHKTHPRRLFPARDDAMPLYVQEQGGSVGRSGELLCVRMRDQPEHTVRVREVSQVSLYGNVQISTQAIRLLVEKNIPVTLSSYGGWFYATISGLPHKNIILRQHQYQVATSPSKQLEIARSLVEQKIRNQRTILRRNHRDNIKEPLRSMKEQMEHVAKAQSLSELLGIEGTAARIYFANFTGLLRPAQNSLWFDMNGRNRRPPCDPINAMLSFAYSMLVREITVVLASVGLEPYLGFYHQLRYGRPSLALDVMEPFRPIIADSVVITAVNNGIIQSDDFIQA